jgi:GT2 family glycosyltransferase
MSDGSRDSTADAQSSVCAVVPAYNAGKTLAFTLACLRAQVLPPGLTLEAIVVDDGSDDDTARVLQQASAEWAELKTVFRRRDSLSSRSRARNLGLAHVRAPRTLLVDATVALPAYWLANALDLSQSANDVVLGETLGLMPEARWPSGPPRGLTPGQFAPVIEQLRPLPHWQDVRLPYFEAAGAALASNACPWVFGWTCAMLIPTSLIREIGGFDESFVGWGGEDVEFSLSLWKRGAVFRKLQDPAALHWPHEAETSLAKVNSMMANRAKIFEKHPDLETEIFLPLGHFASSVVTRLEMLPLEYVVPEYERALIAALLEELSGMRASLLLGAPARLASTLNATHILSPSTQHATQLRDAVPGRTIVRRLGAHLPFEAQAFGTAIVTDFFGGLSVALKLAVIRELRRVAERTIFICSEGLASEASAAFGWSCTEATMLLRLISLENGSIKKRTSLAGCVLIEMYGALAA